VSPPEGGLVWICLSARLRERREETYFQNSIVRGDRLKGDVAVPLA
jgi:hypothetical protein